MISFDKGWKIFKLTAIALGLICGYVAMKSREMNAEKKQQIVIHEKGTTPNREITDLDLFFKRVMRGKSKEMILKFKTEPGQTKIRLGNVNIRQGSLVFHSQAGHITFTSANNVQIALIDGDPSSTRDFSFRTAKNINIIATVTEEKKITACLTLDGLMTEETGYSSLPLEVIPGDGTWETILRVQASDDFYGFLTGWIRLDCK